MTPTLDKLSPCPSCEVRATAWLTEHMEEWNGPKIHWDKRQKDKWCEYLGILTLFTKDFHFPKAPGDE